MSLIEDSVEWESPNAKGRGIKTSETLLHPAERQRNEGKNEGRDGKEGNVELTFAPCGIHRQQVREAERVPQHV